MDIAGWDNLYRSGERGHEDEPTPLLAEILPRLTPGSAIDLACGTGRNAFFLSAHGWPVAALDGSPEAIQTLKKRARSSGLNLHAEVADLTAPDFHLPPNSFDLIVIAFYLQRDLFAKAKTAVRTGGTVLAIVHISEVGEEWNEKRAAPGELRRYFEGWQLLWDYEGPSRDPAHKRAVAEIVALNPLADQKSSSARTQ